VKLSFSTLLLSYRFAKITMKLSFKKRSGRMAAASGSGAGSCSVLQMSYSVE